MNSVSFHGSGFTRAATGYRHRVTLPRWKFEKDPEQKKFVVSLVTALKTVIAALQANWSSRPFSAPVIVIRKPTVSLVARNKFVNRETPTNGDSIFWYRFHTLLIIGNIMFWSVQRLVPLVLEAFHARFPSSVKSLKVAEAPSSLPWVSEGFFSCCLRRKLIVSSGKKKPSGHGRYEPHFLSRSSRWRLSPQTTEKKTLWHPPRVLARRTRAKTSGTRGKAAFKAGQGCYRSVTAALHSEMSFNFKYSHC